jgi:glycine/D-amino acid oxidase-like deaminating enzyme
VIECDSAVVAMGVWSTLLEDWGLGLAVPMEGVKSTSLVYKCVCPLAAHLLPLLRLDRSHAPRNSATAQRCSQLTQSC